LAILAVAVAVTGAHDAAAKDEFREPVWTWRLAGGNGNWGNQGDFDSPEALIEGFNSAEAQSFAQCSARNCATCTQFTVSSAFSPVGGYPIVNGQSTRLTTSAGSTLTYTTACTQTYADGTSSTTPASGPVYTNPDPAVINSVQALLHCPEGGDPWPLRQGPTTYVLVGGQSTANYQAWCAKAVPDPPCPLCQGEPRAILPPVVFGNPVDALGGAKVQSEVDYAAADGLLSVQRTYTSNPGRWHWGVDAALADFTGRTSNSYGVANLVSSIRVLKVPTACCDSPPLEDRPAAFKLIKTQPDTGNKEVWLSNHAGARTVFSENPAGTFNTAALDRPHISYSSAGGSAQWQFRSPRNGKSISYQWNADSVVAQAQPGARTLVFHKNQLGRITAVTLPDGQQITYSVDALGRVQNVAYPDGNTRLYVYGEAANTGTSSARPMWLTGLFDEAGIRHATYRYDGVGPASTELAGGVNKFSFVSSVGSTQVTKPTGSATSMISWETGPDGERRMTSQSQPAGAGSSNASSSVTYDGAGNIASFVDYENHRSCFVHDASGKEITRVEGLSSATSCGAVTPVGATLPTGSRKFSNQWHPDWRLATLVAQPGQVVTRIYNGQPDPFNANLITSCAPGDALLPDGKPIAVLCKQVEQATTDTYGHLGFSAALQSGVPNRVRTWTYNRYGQVLTAKGPRTDINDTTTYSYYTDTTADHTLGDLQSVTDAAGNVTSYPLYNKHGQALRVVDSNGVATDYTYDLRQRLTSLTVGGQTISYEYHPTGLLKRVTQPDGSYVHHTYDDAHRLIAVSDNVGNRIDYTLDNAGNRTAESVKDTSGALRRQVSRSIDALGRVQQTTGRE
jgi:YD repeat-containing protein